MTQEQVNEMIREAVARAKANAEAVAKLRPIYELYKRTRAFREFVDKYGPF